MTTGVTTVPSTAAARTLRLQLFAATWLSYAGFYCTRKVFSVVKGPIKQILHVDDLRVSYIFTIYLVAYMIGMFMSAWLSKRLRNRTQLLLGMSVSIGCNVALGALLRAPSSWTYGAVAVAMAVQGLAQATGWPCNLGLMAQWTRRDERGKILAFWGTCYQLGSVFAKALAAFLFGALGLLWSFWGGALVLAVITVFFYFVAHESPESCGLPSMDEEDAKALAKAGAPPEPDPKIDDAAANRRQMSLLLAMGLIYFAFKFIRYSVDSWSVLIASEHFKLPTSTAGYLSTLYDWVGFVGVILGGFFSDRLGSRMRITWWMTLGLVGATALLWRVGLTSVTMFGLTLGLVGFMSMGPDSLLSGASAMDTGSRRRAAIAAGVINGCGSAGPIVQEPVLGWIKMNYGPTAVLSVLFFVAAAAAAGVWFFWRHTRRLGLNL